MTRVGTRTRVHFTWTRTRVQFFSLWLGLGLRNRDSGPSHARVQAVAAVPCCAVYSDIRYILLFVFMFWKINKCWICGLLDLWLGLEFFFWLGLWGDDSDSDSDFEVMTRTRIWQPGLGHSTAVCILFMNVTIYEKLHDNFSITKCKTIEHRVPGRRTWTLAPSRKTDNVNALLVPGKRAWMIKLSWFKNPISIVNKIAGYDIWRQNLAWYEISTIKRTNDKLATGWIRCKDFKCMRLAEQWVPGKTMHAFTSFCQAHNDKIMPIAQ